MKFQMYVDVVVRDKNGKIVDRRKRKCKSYVRAIIDMLRAHLSQEDVPGTSAVDTGGTSRTLIYSQFAVTDWAVNSAVGTTTHGIRVGTGTTGVTITDYALATVIAEGTGSGQLSHGVTSIGQPTTIGSSRQFTIARTFTNNSGASITVNEVALYARHNDSIGVQRFFMFERSLLTFSIANGSSATVTYTIKVTV